MIGYCPCKSDFQHGYAKNDCYAHYRILRSLFLTSKHDDGSRHAAIARIGAFEVRLLEMPSANSPEEASLWVELYDRDLKLNVDSCKCSDLDEAIDATHRLIDLARGLNNEAREGGCGGTEPLPLDL